MCKGYQIWDHLFVLFFPKDSENQKKFGHWTLGSGGKKLFKQSKKKKKKKKKKNENLIKKKKKKKKK